MESEFRFTLDPAVLGGLGKLFPGPLGTLSPLNVQGATDLNSSQQDNLQSAGIMDAAGNLSAACKEALTVLSKASAYGRVRLSRAGAYLDHGVYFGAQEPYIGLSYKTEGLVVIDPANIDWVLSDLQNYVGSSSIKGTDFHAVLTPNEALALAALVDQRRKALLRSFADEIPIVPGAGDVYTLTSAIANGLSNSIWLTAAIKNIINLQVPPSSPQIQEALNGLVARGYAWQDNNRYLLTEPPTLLADHLAIFSNILSLEGGHANTQDKVAFHFFTIIQASVNDILQLEVKEGKVELHTISAVDLLEKMKKYLTDPEIVPAPEVIITELRLSILSGPDTGRSFPIVEGLLLGRGADCAIQLKDPKASRHHAQVLRNAEGFTINDMGSTNGTFLNGTPLREAVSLREGDTITIGDTRIAVVSEPVESKSVADFSEATVYAGSIAAIQPPPAAPEQVNIPVEPGLAPPPENEPVQEWPSPSTPWPAVSSPIVDKTPVEGDELPGYVAAEPEMPVSNPPVEPVASFLPEPAPEAAQVISPQPEDTRQPVSTPEPLEPPVSFYTPEATMTPPTMPPQVPPAQPVYACPNCGNPFIPGARCCGACGFRLM